jgi:hypothetical protein
MSNYEWGVKVTFGNGTYLIDGRPFPSAAQAANRSAELRREYPARDEVGPEDVADILIVRREVGPWEER